MMVFHYTYSKHSRDTNASFHHHSLEDCSRVSVNSERGFFRTTHQSRELRPRIQMTDHGTPICRHVLHQARKNCAVLLAEIQTTLST